MKTTIVTSFAALLFLSACSSVSRSEFDALKADVASTKQVAEQASQTAEQANRSAQEAKYLAIQTDEKLNRVFRKSQMK